MKNKASSLFNICTLFVLLWGLYGFHWYDTAKGTTIDALSNVFLGINMAICIVCIIQLNRRVLPSFFHGVTVLLLTFILYGVFYIVSSDVHYLGGHTVNKASYLIGILRSYLPLYAFYYFTLKGYIHKKNITFYFVILFVFSLLYNIFFSRYWVAIGYDEGFTNNLGYVFVSFFPFVFLFKNKPVLQYILLAIIVGLTINSMKRGAIFISFILLLWFLYANMAHVKSSKRTAVLFLSVVLLAVGFMFINNLYESSSFLQRRMELTMEGNSSGRDVLYSTLLNHFWNESNWLQQLFGSGPNSTLYIIGKEAHNDWLEILTCQGLFGVAVFAFFWINAFKYWRRIPKGNLYYHIIGTFLLTQFVRTLFSMSYATIPTAATLILGYSLALSHLQMKSRNSLKRKHQENELPKKIASIAS
jgi:hypothetical protein